MKRSRCNRENCKREVIPWIVSRWRLTRGDCSGKIHESLQHKIQKPRGDIATTTRQQQ
jgi:hypothetical protein